MSRSPICVLLALCLALQLLAGCGAPPVETAAPPQEPVVETTAPLPLPIPADGNPNDVTCKGTYSGEGDDEMVVAWVGKSKLTNGELRAWYWAEVGSYQASGAEPAPDFTRALDTQPCEIDSSVNSWQQFFLRRALNNWHGCQALIYQGLAEGLPLENTYEPNQENHDKYLVDIPATKYLYGYQKTIEPNSVHQAWLDDIPAMLEALAAEKGYSSAALLAETAFGTDQEALASFVEAYNRGYICYTNLSYYIAYSQEELEACFAQNAEGYAAEGITKDSGNKVDIRHILLVPSTLPAELSKDGAADTVTVDAGGKVTASDARWAACEYQAMELLREWKKHYRHSGGSFGNLAFKESADTGTALDGGAYRNIGKGQLIEPLDEWCFAQERKVGDTTYIRSEYGVHVLYFMDSTPLWQARAAEDLTKEKQADLLTAARKRYPLAVKYRDILLTEAEAGTATLDDVLYPDVAHERYPEIPLYLQQDYPSVKYGNYPLRSYGCGITTLAMVASYMADDELTPPELCDLYGNYCSGTGTDAALYEFEPGNLGFYLRIHTYDQRDAYAALEEGQIVVSLQHKGYWTRGGHYIALEKLTEDGKIQVRDSNIFNYGKLSAHKEDRHTWYNITANSFGGYWIFEDKVTRIPLCTRCGDPENTSGSVLTSEYTCHKCSAALLRRNTWLEASREG